MPTERLLLLVLNVLGGLAVLGSYAHGIFTHEQPGAALWGGLPTAMRPLYQLSMLPATVGYLAFTHYVYFRLDPVATRLPFGLGYGAFLALYLVVLLPSALWMPLTFAWVARPTPGLWIAIRLLLALVGVGALGLIVAVSRAVPRGGAVGYWLAVAGSVAFAFQTALLDGLIWPAWFPQR